MKPVVTEQTSKKYKGRMLLGGLGCCIGVVMVIGSENPLPGLAVVVVGIALYASGRFSAWWNHG
jgi:hypothetical protein